MEAMGKGEVPLIQVYQNVASVLKTFGEDMTITCAKKAQTLIEKVAQTQTSKSADVIFIPDLVGNIQLKMSRTNGGGEIDLCIVLNKVGIFDHIHFEMLSSMEGFVHMKFLENSFIVETDLRPTCSSQCEKLHDALKNAVEGVEIKPDGMKKVVNDLKHLLTTLKNSMNECCYMSSYVNLNRLQRTLNKSTNT